MINEVSEWERMLSGKLYNTSNKEIEKEHKKAGVQLYERLAKYRLGNQKQNKKLWKN